VLGAHSDDIEIGCGGTLLALLDAHPDCSVQWVVFSASEAREREARCSALAFLRTARDREIRMHRFRDGFLPFEGTAVKECFENLKEGPSPDLIFTHRLEDRHQDHRLLAELTWNTFRNHAILEYEIPKYEGDLGQPNVFVPLDAEVAHRKLHLLMTMFATQRSKRWFREDIFTALMRLRAMEAGLTEEYAEAFYVRKLLLDVGPRCRD
jgi:LmbE family N-acetylglucosaminyl deacetylase